MAGMNLPAPVEIAYRNMRFLMAYHSTNASLNKFLQELKKTGVTTIVSVREAIYNTAILEKEGTQFLDWPFDNGALSSSQIVDNCLKLVKTKFREVPGCCIAVHCTSGLGRAPVMVALALIEGGMKYEDAVQFIRQKRWELITANNFCIWRSILLKCLCASETPKITAAFSKRRCLKL